MFERKAKKYLAIVLGVTNDWAFAAGTVLLGLQKYKLRHDYNIIIYHQGLTKKNKQLLNQIHPCCFVDYHINLIDSKKFSRVSELTFSRYECFGLLSKYKKVLWLDADILIKGDISDLIDKHNQGLAMFKHEGIPIKVSFSLPVSGFDMEKDCFNAGVFLVNDNIENGDLLKEWCYKKTNQWSEKINSDQAIINLLLQEFDLPVLELDKKFNCPPDQESTKTLIVHLWGNKKFWHGFTHSIWNQYFSQWKSLGGRGPTSGFKEKLIQFFKV